MTAGSLALAQVSAAVDTLRRHPVPPRAITAAEAEIWNRIDRATGADLFPFYQPHQAGELVYDVEGGA